ncbi:hypothetical protein BV20DRAFT_793640 [Pilatotrama ljubarskyi]|nr:hypothetical protein BV20DRAFT_793640 [Pilatotrama ljubarskyi]
MNDNSYTISSHECPPQAGNDSTDPCQVLQWYHSQYEWTSSSDEYHPQSDMSSNEAVRRPGLSSLHVWPQYDVLPQESEGPSGRDQVLSPLPLQGMPQIFQFQDTVIPPTPPRPEPALPPMPSPYYGTYASVTPNHPPSTLLTPSSTSHLPVPLPYDSPYGLYTSPLSSSPGQLSLPSYMDSPGMASVSSYHSFANSPSAASISTYWTPMTSPIPLASEFYSPAQAGPSTLPAVPHFPAPIRPSRSAVSECAPLLRIPIPQRIKPSSKRDLASKVHFTSGGVQGIRVHKAVKKEIPVQTVVDNHDDFVLTAGGDRQIHLVIAWPGYKESGTYIKVKQKDTHTLKRGDLARSICSYLKSFMDRAARQGPESSTRWRIGQKGITIDKLWLLSVSPGVGNKWVAELEVQQS